MKNIFEKISLTKHPVRYWLLFLGMVIWFCFIASFHPKQIRKERETSIIRQEIFNEISKMQGSYKQISGRGTRFVLKADFSNSINYDRVKFLNNIVALGYTPKSSDFTNNYRTITFCKNNKSLDIGGYKELLIYYDEDSDVCSK
ncbi:MULTISPECIES: hypothetical protein [Glaesserella]|uniref:Uncharacterized protein n=1 Tax=Glaesserella australis TaxID=2094024 RepID=A0A328C1G1_9PAST|nr:MULTISPECIES: hypothetical protein [Glaesserella]AUI65558.1 hypothetical protein CJD39_02715 [Glaesserella sp. 15-184]RAL19755.1 hypothetical protein C5N92_01800 [Glaesserella australis]